jgi:ABC-type nickel/cobalt efflux system permease component RcnA
VFDVVVQQSDVNVLKTQITGLRSLILDQSNNIQKLQQPYNQPAHRYNATCEHRHYQTPNHSNTDPVEVKHIKMIYYSLIYY